MGGHMTVSSREHSGSTFTFILPYKVSLISDHSDDPDELSDMADDDASTDDKNAGFFQFHPRTLGSLFSSGGSGRTQKLPPNNIGYDSLHKLNGLSDDSYSFPFNKVTSKEMTSLEDTCSVVDAAETLSEPESLLRHNAEPDNDNAVSRGKKCQDEANGQVHNHSMGSTHHSKVSKEVDEMGKTSEAPEMCLRLEISERSSQCTSSSSPEEPKSTLKPKILLVEDSKINVMVTQSMMKQLGHTIDVVNNGIEAVRAVQCRSYDLILMVISTIQNFWFMMSILVVSY